MTMNESMKVKPVTLWKRKNKAGDFEFNHLEDGHTNNAKPTPKHPCHEKAWGSGEWLAEKAWLNENGKIEVSNDKVSGRPHHQTEKE